LLFFVSFLKIIIINNSQKRNISSLSGGVSFSFLLFSFSF